MLPFPKVRLKADAAPIPNNSAIAIQDVVSGNVILVAAFPSSPTLLPIKNWSTIFYSALTSIAIILGTANFLNNMLIGSSPKLFLFLFSISFLSSFILCISIIC